MHRSLENFYGMFLQAVHVLWGLRRCCRSCTKFAYVNLQKRCKA